MALLVTITMLRGLTLAGIILALTVPPHPNHVTLTELFWNPKTGNFEVAICVWPDELEKAIAQQAELPIRLEDDDVEKRVHQYVKSRFKMTEASKGQATPMRWVGMEIAKKRVWLYFEVKPPKTVKKWRVENSLFFELNDDQINHLKIKEKKAVSWHFWNATQPIVHFQIQPTTSPIPVEPDQTKSEDQRIVFETIR